MPDWNRADLNGLVAACRTASRRVVEMCERFGTATYLSALDALLQRNYDAMKVLLSLVFEEGRTLSFTDYICDDGVGNGPYELKLSLTRTGEKVHLDFTGSSPQAAGPINYYINENCTAAATASTSRTCSPSRVRSRSTTTAGSPTRGASTAAPPGRAAPSGWNDPTVPARCCRRSATT